MRRSFWVVLVASVLAAGPAWAAQPQAEVPSANEVAAPAEQVAHGEHHAPSFGDINWIYGWFGERPGVEPSLWFRPTGMPAPFGMLIFNAVVLYAFILKKTRKPLAEALKQRKASILRGMDDAARMKRDAEQRLAEYEERLSRIEEEIERVRRDMREAAELERASILAEARARRGRMERDAQLLIEQELAAARDALKVEMVKGALSSATTAVRERLQSNDQQRLADEYLAGLSQAGGLRVRA